MQCTDRSSEHQSLNIGAQFGYFSGLLYRRAIHSISASFDPYHPVRIGDATLSEGERSCADRWTIIEDEVTSNKAKTLLDLGCAEGYFVQKAAATCGCFALGVDGDVRRLSIAQASILLNHIKGAAFLYADITCELISLLQVFDIVLFQSVLHHIMYSEGVDYARDVMKSIRPKIGKLMIFDMGQSNEMSNTWAKLLPDMGSNPQKWIEEFLRSAGYTVVEKVGNTDSYRSGIQRTLFRLMP